MYKLSKSFGLFMSLFLAGCVSVQPFDQADRDALQQELPDLPAEWASSVQQSESSIRWLQSFNDPLLEQLIAEAQENNPEILAAAANLEGSRAQLAQARSVLSPAVSFYSGAGRSGSFAADSTDVDAYSLGGQLSWEVDLWGRLRNGVMGANYSHEALAADLIYARQSLAANTAILFFSAIEARLQAEIARENVQVLENTLRIVTARYRDGMESSQDMALARSDLASARESLVATEGGYRQVLRALEILVGRYPAASLEVQTSLPGVPPLPPAGLPSDLLERRPDLVAAERRVAGSFNAISQAKAARLPSLSLTGDIGGASTDLSDLLDPLNSSWSLASNLLAPLIDGGLLKAQVEAADAESRQAIAAYQDAALSAFSEVENALDQGVVIAQRAEDLQEASSEADRAFNIANMRYQEGESDLLDVLTIQQRVIATKSNLLSIQRQQLEQRINLHLALGGDWRI